MYAPRGNDERELWCFLPAEPGIEHSFKRWNLIVISLLALLVLSAFVAGLGSEALHGAVASAPSQVVHHHAAIVPG
jgi:hypothetical protein